GGQRLEVGLWQAVLVLVCDEGLVECPDRSLHQQLQAAWPRRVVLRARGNHEDPDLPQARRALGLQVADAPMLVVANPDRLGALVQLDAIEDAAAHVARSLERVESLAGDDDRVLARLHGAGT